MATAQSFEFLANDLAALGDRIESIGSRNDHDAVALLPRADSASPKIRRSLLVILTVVFAFGLLLGWLVIGWWLWPVDWSSTTPGETSSEYQQMLISWAANRYWETGDAAQIQRAFADWDRQDLAKKLLTLQRTTTDVETRRRLIALTDVLKLPVTESSLMTFVFTQPIMLLSILLSVAPLLAAFTMVTVPRMRKSTQPAEETLSATTPAEESLDAFLGVETIGEMPAPGEETKEGEKKDEAKKEETPPGEESEGESGGLGDLASLFEEEDTSINVLEAFCKGMPEVSIDELMAMGANIARQLKGHHAG